MLEFFNRNLGSIWVVVVLATITSAGAWYFDTEATTFGDSAIIDQVNGGEEEAARARRVSKADPSTWIISIGAILGGLVILRVALREGKLLTRDKETP
jgi:hypothetical protein